MMEGFFEIISILIGRFVFGKLGFFIRKGWSKLFKSNNKSRDDSGIEKVIDVDDFNNRIVGFTFISIFIITIMLLSHYL